MSVNKIEPTKIVVKQEQVKRIENKNPHEVKIKVKQPIKKDTFEKQQPVDKEGKIVNKNGVINN